MQNFSLARQRARGDREKGRGEAHASSLDSPLTAETFPLQEREREAGERDRKRVREKWKESGRTPLAAEIISIARGIVRACTHASEREREKREREKSKEEKGTKRGRSSPPSSREGRSREERRLRDGEKMKGEGGEVDNMLIRHHNT